MFFRSSLLITIALLLLLVLIRLVGNGNGGGGVVVDVVGVVGDFRIFLPPKKHPTLHPCLSSVSLWGRLWAKAP